MTYCKASTDSAWPKHVGVVLNYLHERHCEPCNPSVPQAILRSLSFLERVGGVQATQRLSELQVVRNTVNQLTMDLQTGAPPKRQAPVLPLAMIAALEITVCDVSCSLYLRGFAFYKLLKLWAAARHSDLEGLDPSSLVLTVQGLEGRLDRTKTSGPVFISRAAFLLRPEWLATGVEIWNHANMAFERDYFLPLPTADWKGCLKSMASYSQMVAFSKYLWRSLRTLVRDQQSWVFSEQQMFASLDAVTFWSEHSERNCLNSVLAALEVPREQRDYLGRWRATTASDEYIRSARVIVMHLQMQAVQGLCADPSGNLRSLGIPELLDHLRSACLFCEEEIRELREVLMIPSAVIAAARVTADASLVKSLDETPPERQEVNDVLVDAADSAPFFAVLGKRRLLRLHKAGGCPATPSELRE